MTETPASETSRGPQEGIAGALHDLSDQTRALVRQEIAAAVIETWQKTRQSVPVLALFAASGACGLAAAASSYRLTLRLLEKRLSPAAAACTATVGYGAMAAGAAVLGAQRMHELPVPLPIDTAREARDTVAEAVTEAADTAAGTAAARPPATPPQA